MAFKIPAVIKSFFLRTVVSAALAGLAFITDNVSDLGTSADNAALITFGVSYVVHAVHAIAVKNGIEVKNPLEDEDPNS